MLRRCISNGRLPQALLLAGSEGAGAAALALAFARTMVCESPRADVDGPAPCETCRSCRQSASLQHSDIRIVVAYPAGKADSDDDLKTEVIEEIRSAVVAMAEDPYREIRLTGATQIRIGQIRELKRSLSLSSSQGGRRVVIILRADEMTTEASNAFLKTLEEPHADVTVILVTSRPERILPTISSRCQELVIPPIDDVDIADALVRRGLCDETEARLTASFAQGSFTRAVALLSDDMKTQREDIVDLLRTSLKGRDFRPRLISLVADIAEGRDKVRIETMLGLLALWLRDAHMIAAVGPNAAIVNTDQRDALIKFADAFGAADFPSALTVIERSVREVYRNVHPQLTLLTMCMTIRRLLYGARSAQGASA